MKSIKVLLTLAILVVFMLSGCQLFDPRTSPEPTPETTPGINPVTPEPANTPVTTVSPEGTSPMPTTEVSETSNQADDTDKDILKSYLPPLDTKLRYFGLAEYGHIGQLTKEKEFKSEAMYEFKGQYQDGIGTPDKFVVRYYINFDRTTITEMVISNERTGQAEVNSKLHNIVVLKLPIKEGKTWRHKTTIDGKRYTVYAKIVKVDDDTIKVRYEVPGVDGYYDDTYIEERTFEKGYGMTGFSNLMKGDIGISEEDAKDEEKLRQALVNHMFGYSLAKLEVNK